MVHIEKQTDAETKEVWSFNLFDTKAVFVGWAKYTKPKGKRKWEVVSLWDKYARRNSITVPEPELPKEIKELAFQEMVKRIQVMTWNEWKSY